MLSRSHCNSAGGSSAYNGRMSVETALQALRLEPRFMRNIARWEIIRPTRALCVLSA